MDRLTVLQQQDQSGGNSLTPKRLTNNCNANGQKTFVNRYEATSNTSLSLRTVYHRNEITQRLDRLQHREVSSGSSTQLHQYSFTYDNMERITSINSTAGGTAVDGLSSYSYDKTSQLTDAAHAVPRPDESFTYDNTGNRTGGSYVVGADNLTTSDATYDYDYDKEGNRTKRTNKSTGQYDEYTWDHRNRLVSVETFSSANVSLEKVGYAYDAFNRMISRSYDADGAGSGAATDQFFAGFDGDNPTFEFDGDDASDLVHRNLWEGDHLIAQENVASLGTDGEVLWPLTDQVGTIRDTGRFNDSTNKFEVANHRVFDSFGNLTSETNARRRPTLSYLLS